MAYTITNKFQNKYLRLDMSEEDEELVYHHYLFISHFFWAILFEKSFMMMNTNMNTTQKSSPSWSYLTLSNTEDGTYQLLTPSTSNIITPLTPRHLISNDQEYKNKQYKQQIKCVISTLLVMAFLFIFINIIGYKYFIIAYLPCFMVFNYWLYTVTYMQHHDEISKTGSIMYDDSTFTFLEGALQTIDRK
eukprot:324310_1